MAVEKLKLLRTLFSLCIAMAVCAIAHSQQIAFTWDDLPVHGTLPPGESRVEIGKKLITAMKDAHMPPVYGFVNGAGAEREPIAAPMLKEWLDAGLPLGNHTWSHMNLDQRPLEDWEADTLKNEPQLQSLMGGQDWHWLRYPYLAEGDTPAKREAARAFLASHGYKIAAVTMSFADYLYNDPYTRCVAKNDSPAIAQVGAAYLAAAATAIDYSRSMSKTLYSRDIPYVLLMHVGALDARMLPRLLKLYSDRGFTFITLEDAEKDAFYKNDLDLTLPPAPDTLEEAMRLRDLPLPPHTRPAIDLNSICR